MSQYLIKYSSNKLKFYIMKLIILKIDLSNIRMATVELLNLGAPDSIVFEYEKLHDEYYLSLGGDGGEA